MLVPFKHYITFHSFSFHLLFCLKNPLSVVKVFCYLFFFFIVEIFLFVPIISSFFSSIVFKIILLCVFSFLSNHLFFVFLYHYFFLLILNELFTKNDLVFVVLKMKNENIQTVENTFHHEKH